MTSRKVKRIMNEIKELYSSEEILKNSGIYFNISEDSIEKIQLLFVGNEDTPYENGFYLFELTYPDNYPMIPPKMKYYTQGFFNNPKNKLFNVRFNPNLYTNGKVCLSMLNTWNGPGWVPTNTISNVIVAIQALVLNKNPLQNEPGFESAQKEELEKYNDIIRFSNYKISILDQVNKGSKKEKFKNFDSVIRKIFLDKVDKIDNNLIVLMDQKNNEYIYSRAYNMNMILDYKELYNYFRIVKIKAMIDDKDKDENVKESS